MLFERTRPFNTSKDIVVLVYYSLNSSFMKFLLVLFKQHFTHPIVFTSLLEAKLFEIWVDDGLS